MPLIINSTTNLNKLKFTSSGGDRWDQGKSGQPYIIKPIPGVDDTFQQQLDGQPLPKSGVDFLLRGGLLSVDAALNDVSRVTQMLFDTKSPNGFEFIAKQNVLSRQSVKTEASFGIGYGGGGVNQGVYTPLNTILQTGAAPLATGKFNLFGVNPSTDISPLSGPLGDERSNNGGVNSYFDTINTQNIIQDGSWVFNNRLVLLNQGISFGTEETTVGGNITLNPDNAGVNILNYSGGPGSTLLFGKTNIRFSDQRTGFKNFKLPLGIDGGPSFINPTGPNNYGIFGNVYNPTIEASITGVTNVSNPPSTVVKANLFHVGATRTFLDNFSSFNNNPVFGLKLPTAEFFEGLSLFAGGKDFNSGFEYGNMAEGGLYTFNNNVYKGSGSLVENTSNRFITQEYGTEVLNQEQLYTASVNNVGARQQLNPSDFRNVKRNNDKFNKNPLQSPVSSILSLAPNYVTQNANQLFNQGDPGKSNPTVNIKGEAGLGAKNVWNYAFSPSGSMAKTALDKINALAMYTSSSVNTLGATNDSCQFNIAVINNKDQGATNIYIHFRAFLDSFSDSYGANWNEVQYVGRAEKLYNYAGFNRDISMDFTVYAQSKAELIPMYKKLNYLASTLAPDYSEAGYMRGNIVKMTVGGYLFDQPGIIKSLNYTIPMESTWEIAINNTDGKADSSVKQLPHMIKVTGLTFTPIHKFIPALANTNDGISATVGTTGILDPKEKYIALANNNATNNYQDIYENNFAAVSTEDSETENFGPQITKNNPNLKLPTP